MMPPSSRRFGVAGLTFILSYVWLASLASANEARGGTVHVKSGQSIQAAVDTAHPGQWILVEAGTYAERLTIERDEINLVGLGAILVPPSSPTHNTCSGLAGPHTEAGICVTGHDVKLAPFKVEHRKVVSVGRPVKDVLITGFDVRGFSGINIAVVGAQNAQVIGNILADGEQYGCLTVGSSNTHVDGNNVFSSAKLRSIGICMDDKANVQVSNNHISGYAVGLCVQTSGADVRHNDVINSCIGVFVDPAINGAKVYENHISDANHTCATIDELGINGITLDGSTNTEVQHNLIEGLTVGGLPNKTAVAVAIVDDSTTKPVAVASGNMIIENILRHNDLDIFVQTAGVGNIIENNQCSTPSKLCASK